MANFLLPPHFSIFPVNGKKPLVEWTPFQTRLATKAEKEKWANWPSGHGWGIACGPISKLFVLDVDGPDGRKSIEGKPLPKTPTVATPRADGGVHLYFQWVPELEGRVTTKANVLPGIDVRGEGGFVAFYGWKLPPSVVPFAKPPQWLVDALPMKPGYKVPEKPKAAEIKPQEATEAPKSWLAEKLGGLKEGNRNETFTAVAGSLRARDYKGSEIFDLLIPRAREIGFPESELRTICESVGRYTPRQRATEPEADSVEDFLADRKPVEWLCRPCFARGSISFVAGLPETQKTWLMLDFAIEAARGGKWLERYPIEKSRVIFIDQERPKSETQRRIAAMLKGKKLSMNDIKDQLFIRCGSTVKIDLQHSFEAFRKYLGERKPDIVIVDSLATFHTREESNRMEIQFVLEKVKELRDEFGCSFVFLHHETKMAFQSAKEGQPSSYLDMAGNVAIPAAAEHVFNMRRQDSASCFLYHTKNNLGMKIPNMLTKVTDLDPEQSAIVVEAH